jgi:hypothetical protein
MLLVSTFSLRWLLLSDEKLGKQLVGNNYICTNTHCTEDVQYQITIIQLYNCTYTFALVQYIFLYFYNFILNF